MILEKIKDNNRIILLPMFAILSFSTWFFNVPETYNIIGYILILILLIVSKTSTTTIIMFALFTSAANRKASYLGTFSNFTFLFQAIIIGVLLYSVTQMIIKKALPRGKLVFPILALLGYTIISLLWTPDKAGGLSEIGIIIQGYLVYFSIRNNKEKKVSFNEISWFLSLLLLVISLEYFVLTYKVFPFEGKGPLYALWANPNIVATFYSIAFVPSLYKYFAEGKSRWIYLYLPIELLIIYGIYVSKSEGLYAALIIGFVFSIVQLLFKNKKALFVLTMSLIVGFVIAMFTIVLLKDTYPDFYNKINKFSSSRLSIYSVALNQIKQPFVFLFGRGAGSAHFVLLENGFKNFYYHSWFIHLWAQRGIVSLIIMFYLFYKAYLQLIKNNSKFKYFLATGIIIYLTHTLVDIGFEYQYIGVILFLMVGSLENYNDYSMSFNNNISKSSLFITD